MNFINGLTANNLARMMPYLEKKAIKKIIHTAQQRAASSLFTNTPFPCCDQQS
jgi:hypothetical protein